MIDWILWKMGFLFIYNYKLGVLPITCRTNLAAAIHEACKLIKSGLDPFSNDMLKYDSSQTDLLLGQEDNDDAKSDSKQFLGLQQNFKQQSFKFRQRRISRNHRWRKWQKPNIKVR